MPGVCTIGDLAKTTTPHTHGCPACPHICQGPAITASANVKVGGKLALRQGDMGLHAVCCGPNMWVVQQASGQVFINGSPMVRVGDKTLHCSTSPGKMITGSGVVVDGSGMFSTPFGAPAAVTALGPPVTPQLTDEQRAALPCDHPLYSPPGEDPVRPSASPIRDPEGMRRQREARLDLADALGIDTSAQRTEDENRINDELARAEQAVSDLQEVGGDTLKRAQENRDRLRNARVEIQMSRGGGAGPRRGGPGRG
jgi:uncharacterized Zn-binding protein involved in type VI secretion